MKEKTLHPGFNLRQKGSWKVTNITEGHGNDRVAAGNALLEQADKLRHRLRSNDALGPVSDRFLCACELSHDYVCSYGRSLREGAVTQESVLESLEWWENFVAMWLCDGMEGVPSLVGELVFAAAMRAWFKDYLKKLNEGETDV